MLRFTPIFIKVRDDPRNAPTRAMMRRIAEQMEDPDGNLIEQFQTFGFDARTFEIYLDALFRSEGHTIDRSQPRPDFIIERDGLRAAVEAVTSNPTPTGVYQRYEPIGRSPATDMAGIVHHLRNEVQIRMGSALYSKSSNPPTTERPSTVTRATTRSRSTTSRRNAAIPPVCKPSQARASTAAVIEPPDRLEILVSSSSLPASINRHSEPT